MPSLYASEENARVIAQTKIHTATNLGSFLTRIDMAKSFPFTIVLDALPEQPQLVAQNRAAPFWRS